MASHIKNKQIAAGDPPPLHLRPATLNTSSRAPSTVYDVNGLQNNDARSMLLLLLLAPSVHPFVAAGGGEENKTTRTHSRARTRIKMGCEHKTHGQDVTAKYIYIYAQVQAA